jgi:hypothetical protein
MVQKVWELYMKFQFDGSVDRIYVDGANPSFIRSLKLALGEREDYEKVIEQHKHASKLWSDPQKYMTVVPVNFAKEHNDVRCLKQFLIFSWFSYFRNKFCYSFSVLTTLCLSYYCLRYCMWIICMWTTGLTILPTAWIFFTNSVPYYS